MAAEVILHRPAAVPERRALAGVLSAGGDDQDSIRLPGAPAGALLVHAGPGGLVVEARVIGVRAAGRVLPPGARRLLRPGERAEVRGSAIEAAPMGSDATRALAGALLREVAAGGAPVPGAHLLLLTGPQAGRRFSLGSEETVGRGHRATIRLEDPRASRLHARLRILEAGASIEDLRSKNGLRVNGCRLGRGAHPLRTGDEIAVGANCLSFVGAADDPAPSAGAAGHREALPARPSSAPRNWDRVLPLVAALLGLSAAALALGSTL